MSTQVDIFLGEPVTPRTIFGDTVDRVVHCKRDDFDTLIDRSTIWGNPFGLADFDGDRIACGLAYCKWLAGEGRETHTVGTRPNVRSVAGGTVAARAHYLEGKTLGCWCSPKLCHGHVLAALAAAEDQRRELERIIDVMEGAL